jgi:D-aspartate ligase
MWNMTLETARGQRQGQGRRATPRVPASDPPALVFGGDVTGLAVLRSLGRNGIPAFAASPSPHLVRSRWYRPAPGEPVEETSDGRRLAAHLMKLPIEKAVLIPASDDWALALASLPEHVAASYPATVGSRRVLKTLIDKERFGAMAEELGVPTPRTIPVTGPESLDEIDEPDLPSFFLKPRNSQEFARRFGVKALRLAGRGDAEQLLRRVAGEGLEVVLQEFVPGPPTAHVFLDGYVDRGGAMRACLARRRLRMYPAEFGNSTRSVTIPLEEVGPALESLHRLFDGIGFSGFFDAEFKHDERDGRFKIFEVNARPWWQLELAEASGLNVCRLAYMDALGQELPDPPGYEVGRTWVHPLPDLRAWWAGRRSGGTAGGFPLRAWLGGANAVFSLDDPMPGLSQLAWAARKVAGSSLPGRRRR